MPAEPYTAEQAKAALKKMGNSNPTQDEINECGDLSIKVGAKIREQLKLAQQESQ